MKISYMIFTVALIGFAVTTVVFAATFDGDAYPDIIYGSGVSVRMVENEGGTVTSYHVWDNMTATAIAVGNLDEDIYGDILISDTQDMYWAECTGDNAFTAKGGRIDNIGNSTDMEFCGHDVYSIINSNRIIKIFSSADDTWSYTNIAYASDSQMYDNLEITDIDNDGKLEMLVAWEMGRRGGIDVFEQQSDSSWTWLGFGSGFNLQYADGLGQIGIGDIDGDVYPDIILGLGPTRTYYYESNGTNNTIIFKQYIDYTRAEDILFVDMDKDGIDEVVLAASSTLMASYDDASSTFTWIKDANGNHIYGAQSRLLTFGDWDGDGDIDLLYGVTGASSQGIQYGDVTGSNPLIWSGRLGWIAQYETTSIDGVMPAPHYYGTVIIIK